MDITVEFKARCDDPERVRETLTQEGADYRGRDHQLDVYFNARHGRLKLRKGTIENSLIHYEREDHAGTKQSNVRLYRTDPGTLLEDVLTHALGVKTVVDKQRDIYFIGNVKFHVDDVMGLGAFVEVEAIGTPSDRERLQQQCDHYRRLLGVRDDDMIAVSYCDLKQKRQPGAVAENALSVKARL